MGMQTAHNTQDAGLVERIVAGDKDAYAWLVERHSRSLFALAFRVSGNESDAEEIVQETFLRAYRNLHRFERRSSFSTWLFRIAMNCALDMKAAKKRPGHPLQISEEPEPGEHEIQLAADDPSPERMVISAQIKEKIAQAMKLLTHTERAAFVMRHLEGRSIDEIGSVLELKPNAAKNSVFRAVQKMRAALGPLVGNV